MPGFGGRAEIGSHQLASWEHRGIPNRLAGSKTLTWFSGLSPETGSKDGRLRNHGASVEGALCTVLGTSV